MLRIKNFLFMGTLIAVCFRTICTVYFNLLNSWQLLKRSLSTMELLNRFAQLFRLGHPSLTKTLLHNAVPVTELGLLQSPCLMTYWKHYHFLLRKTVAASNRMWGSRQFSLTVKTAASWRGTMT
jgi:hypothetical protein